MNKFQGLIVHKLSHVAIKKKTQQKYFIKIPGFHLC